MIEQREEPRQRSADGSAKQGPIDVTDLFRDGAAPGAELAKGHENAAQPRDFSDVKDVPA